MPKTLQIITATHSNFYFFTNNDDLFGYRGSIDYINELTTAKF